ncbi:probable salivary secreted peptide [Stomoxys calcitrans]|uniref:probable salivary secreted peptide n=1 Tax=Stomoxys calcitrans TaxID=35570 RepID=UPI0027E2A339|nr:probable salivary secreted peptide [Stomoxys calcitrans]
MKILLWIAVIASVATMAYCRNNNWGQRQPGDSLVFTKHIKIPAKSGVMSGKSVSYDPWFIKPQITNVVVTDNLKGDNEATATLLNGGPGKKFAKIRLVSKQSKPLDATIEIYAKK